MELHAPSRTVLAGTDSDLVDATVAELVRLLGRAADCTLTAKPLEVRRLDHRVAGEGGAHVSFRFRVQEGAACREGCLLLPFPEANTLAGRHLMLPPRAVSAWRKLPRPDEDAKEALRQLDRVVATAIDRALVAFTYGRQTVRPRGPQGVRSGIRPALAYEDGDELLVAVLDARLETYPPFYMLLMLPPPEPGFGQESEADLS